METSKLKSIYRMFSTTDQARWTRWQAIKMVHKFNGKTSNSPLFSNERWRREGKPQEAAPPPPFVLKGHYALAHELTKPGESVLEVGCGTGGYLSYLQERGACVLGVDHSTEALKIVEERGVPTHLHDLSGDEPLPTGYDVVLCLEVLEHFSDPWRVYKKLWEAAGTRVVFSVPYKHLVPAWGHLYEFDYRDLVDGLKPYGPVNFIGGNRFYIIGSQVKPQ